MAINFIKMQGLGNDFAVLDCTSQNLALSPQQIKKMADRHFGIGFDQLLVVQPPTVVDADFDYLVFNTDGTAAGQCGNGARCVARYIVDYGLSTKRNLKLATRTRILEAEVRSNSLVAVNMGVPQFEPKDIPVVADREAKMYGLDLGDIKVEMGLVNMGNPHAVILVEDLERAPVSTLGTRIESHPNFPERVNVGFMQIIDRQHICLRVFERGVGETLACGSGACAAVVVGQQQGLLGQIVAVDLPGGRLTIDWSGEGSPVIMTGPAEYVYMGQWLN